MVRRFFNLEKLAFPKVTVYPEGANRFFLGTACQMKAFLYAQSQYLCNINKGISV
jgi:hypothetical protein